MQNNKVDLYDFFNRNVIGFDELAHSLFELNGHSDQKFPPYNIKTISNKPNDGETTILEIAIAGYDPKDISILKNEEKLIVSYNKDTNLGDVKITKQLYSGIASRTFRLSFLLEKGVIIKRAYVKYGLLSIEMGKPKPTVKPEFEKIKIEVEN